MPIKGQSPKQVVSTEMHKWKHGQLHSGSKKGPLVKSRKQAIAIALSESGQSNKYDLGGSVDNDYISPYDLSQTKGEMPRSLVSQSHYDLPPPRDPQPSEHDYDDFKYDDGGGVGDIGDPGGGAGLFGNLNGMPGASKAADVVDSSYLDSLTAGPLRRFIGSQVDAAHQPLGSEEYRQAIENGVAPATADLAFSMMGRGRGPQNTSGVFVGPYGAMMLRNAERDAGKEPLLHPNVRALHEGPSPVGAPDAGTLADRMDTLGQKALAQPTDPATAGDIFRATGWSRGAEGLARKEIPDTGVKFQKVRGKDEYQLKHPAGDLHQIYDVPNFKFNSNMTPGEGTTWVDGLTGTVRGIELGGNPNNPAHMKEAIPVALHELQHVIQAKEGFASGAAPKALPKEVSSPELQQQMLQENFSSPMDPQTPFWWTNEQKRAAERARAKNFPENSIQDQIAKFHAYRNESGEVEARNVMDRYRDNNYGEHPEDTEDVPRGLQWQWRRWQPRSQEDVDKALQNSPQMRRFMANQRLSGRPRFAGGGIVPGGFNPERSEAYGLARQGMLNSRVPGRTDKLNLNVPTGSYIIPADITSALGEGNSMAGASVLDKMFSKGPYGMNITKHTAPRVQPRMSSLSKMVSSKVKFASGGGPGGSNAVSPIVAAGGEYVVHPDSVAALGNGDTGLGHDILDAFVDQTRQKHIKTLRGLKPPKGSKQAGGR